MTFKCGIVGLPNVGKSTLFNAITSSIKAEASNYPFCTIEPNISTIAVYDQRLEKISKINHSEKIIPNFIDIVDIAGLVKGASKGDGLGNKFLANIKEVDAIIHVIRCFDDSDIIHVDGNVDPVRDYSVINTELFLADLESVDKIIENLQKKVKANKILQNHIDLAIILKQKIESEEFLFSFIQTLSKEERKIIKTFNLLTTKPIIYIANFNEKSIVEKNQHFFNLQAILKNEILIPLCAKIESDMIEFSEDEKIEMLRSLNMDNTGIKLITKACYDKLGLITFFTAGPKETHAWSLKSGSFAPEAAGTIHSDFEKGFIKAETISYDDYLNFKGEMGAKSAGKLKIEGKEYLVKDGDVMNFKFNV